VTKDITLQAAIPLEQEATKIATFANIFFNSIDFFPFLLIKNYTGNMGGRLGLWSVVLSSRRYFHGN